MSGFGKKIMNRRLFLTGAAGVTFSLPFLDAFQGKAAIAAGNDQVSPRFFVAVRSGNGVQQAYGNEGENFWPMQNGALTAAMMRDTTNGKMRATGELADYAEKLLFVSGTKYSWPGNGCGHSGGGNQCLTATPPSQTPSGNRSLGTGESLDNFIQRTLCPNDTEPLTLISGRASSYLEEVLSFRRPAEGETNGRLRSAERDPWEAYKSIFGLPDDNTGMLENYVGVQRKSINDLMREQLDRLKNNNALSRSDLNRIDLHQQSIRDLETRMMECHLPETRWKEIQNAGESGTHDREDNEEDMTHMMMDIIALSFACDLKRAATLQIGAGNDPTAYREISNYPFHWISHRIQGNGATGSAPVINDAAGLHHLIDRLQMRRFRYLLEKLTEYSTASGTILDSSVALWTNDLASGVGHSYRNLPHIIAGSADGYLKTGQYLDARDTGNKADDGWVAHSQMFNTIANAVGVGEALGKPVDDFGHKGDARNAAAKGGEINGMKA